MPRINQRGHRVDSQVIVSEIGYDVSANYRVPVFNPRTDQLVYSISASVQKYFDIQPFILKAGVKTGLKILYRF